MLSYDKIGEKKLLTSNIYGTKSYYCNGTTVQLPYERKICGNRKRKVYLRQNIFHFPEGFWTFAWCHTVKSLKSLICEKQAISIHLLVTPLLSEPNTQSKVKQKKWKKPKKRTPYNWNINSTLLHTVQSVYQELIVTMKICFL